MELAKTEEELLFNDDYAGFVNKEFHKRQSERTPFELQWRLNMEFIKGNQFLTINDQLKTIEEVPKLEWYQEREVFNQIATIVETRIARISRQKPIMKTRPTSTEPNDISAAKVSSSLLLSKWYDDNMGEKYDDLIAWMEHTGTGILKAVWNNEAGRKIGEMEGQVIKEGDIETVVVSPFEIYPDSNHRNNIRDCKSIIHAKAFPVSEIQEKYGVKVDEEKVEATTLQSQSGLGGVGYNATNYRTKTENLKGHAIVKEYWEHPSKKYPKGRLIVVAGEKTLYAGELPYMIGEDNEPEFPFIFFPCIKIPNQLWGVSVTERCIPIQRRYNALRNRKAEYLNLVAIGQWYEPEGSIDDDTELNNEPGNRIRYQSGLGRPEPVAFPSLPNSFEMEESSLLRELTSISGVSELSRYSEAPSGVKSGVALSITNEQDDTRISMTTSRVAEGSKTLGRMWLRLYKQFTQEPRILRHVGESKEVDVQYWTANQLTSEDVIVENASALSETPSQRRQMVFDLMASGVFNRPDNNPYSLEGVRRILDMLELGHWETGIDDEEQLQTSYARREQSRFMQGQPSGINDFDNHEVHLREHNQFRMKPEYQMMLQTPQGQMLDQMFQQHINEHRNMVYQQQMMEQQQQMMMQGGH